MGSAPMTVASTTAQVIAGPFVRYLPTPSTRRLPNGRCLLSVCPRSNWVHSRSRMASGHQQVLSAVGGTPYTYIMPRRHCRQGSLSPDGDLSGVPTRRDLLVRSECHRRRQLPASNPTLATSIRRARDRPSPRSKARPVSRVFPQTSSARFSRRPISCVLRAIEAKIKQAKPTKLKLKIQKMPEGWSMSTWWSMAPSATVSFEVK